MADELTPKQEAFALAYVETGNASEAYRRSYDVGEDTKPETIWPAASRILADSKVSARVKELQAEARDLAMVSIGTITEELEDARKMAMEEKSPAAAISASMGKAKLHGLLIDKVEATGKGGKDLAEVSPRAIAREIAFAMAAGLRAAE